MSIFNKYPKLVTVFLSIIIVGGFLVVLGYLLKMDILQDYVGGEKYSVADKIIYAIRCNDTRAIRLRELKPNHDYIRIPSVKHNSLEQKQYNLRSDSDGMIKPSFIHKNPDLQIFFVGGSTTECEYVDEELRFPYLVGRKLENILNIKVNSDNAARSGNNSIHNLDIIINKILPYNPDVIVMMEALNDLSTLMYEGSYWNLNKTKSPLICAKKSEKSLQAKDDEWGDSVWNDKVVNDKQVQENIVKQFKQNLQLFINIARAKNIIPVLMTQENRIENDVNFSTGRSKEFDIVYRRLYKKFNETIRQIGKEEGVLVIDLARLVPSEEKYIYDILHFNKEGSILASEIISKELSAYLKRIKFVPKTGLKK